MNMFSNQTAKDKLSDLFRDFMERCDVLPVQPWNNKKTRQWVESQGCRMTEFESFVRDEELGFVSVWVKCKSRRRSTHRHKGYLMSPLQMLIMIPLDLAEKMLVLGFIP